MRRNKSLVRHGAVVLSGSMLVALTLWAIPTAAQEDSDTKDPAFAQEFWNYLQEVDYQKNWSRWPGHEEGFKESASERHGALLKVYVNDEVTGNVQDPPPKSIIIKENYNKDKELVAITPMYRVPKDYDPEHNNWFWAKYKPDGPLFEMNGKKISGKVNGCIQCHSSAKGDDFIFSNDQGN